MRIYGNFIIIFVLKYSYNVLMIFLKYDRKAYPEIVVYGNLSSTEEISQKDEEQPRCSFCWKRQYLLRSCSSLLKKFAMDKAILPIADSICLVTRTRGSTCTNRTLRTGGWLTDLNMGTQPLEDHVRPLPSYSNSLGNEVSRLVAGCHFSGTTIIVTGG